MGKLMLLVVVSLVVLGAVLDIQPGMDRMGDSMRWFLEDSVYGGPKYAAQTFFGLNAESGYQSSVEGILFTFGLPRYLAVIGGELAGSIADIVL